MSSDPRAPRESRSPGSKAGDSKTSGRASGGDKGSLEQLDLPMELIDTRSWLLLSGIVLFFLVAGFWGVFGSIPTRVQGSGLIFAQSGSGRAITSTVGGRLIEILVRPGDRLEEGQIVARLDQPELKEQLENTLRTLEALTRQRAEMAGSYDEFLTRQHGALDRQKLSLQEELKWAQETVDAQQAIVRDHENLLQRGLISRVEFESVREKFTTSMARVSQIRTSLAQVDADNVRFVAQRQEAMRDYDSRIIAAEQLRDEQKAKLELVATVRSPAAGYVATIDSGVNTTIAPGGLIATLGFAGRELEALVFVPPSDGKMVTKGMRVNVSPSTVKPEEYGTVVGEVIDVGVVPETRTSMMALLNNEALVTQFMSLGAPFLVRVALAADSETPSGLRWTSGEGPDLELSNGTLVRGDIVVREKPPIALVIPTLERWVGIYP